MFKRYDERYKSQWTKIWKNVQFRETELFPPEAKINIFWTFFEQSKPERDLRSGEKKTCKKTSKLNYENDIFIKE